MNNIYDMHKEEIKKALEKIWRYMNLGQTLEKCDLIIGCGCSNLDIPIKCANLLKQGYASRILFAGGIGKITKDSFKKSEAEVFKDIAIQNGVSENDILIETESTNTGDNFKFAKKILENNDINYEKILIVHNPINERRSLAAAQAVFKDKYLIITSPEISFEEYFERLDNKSFEEILRIISVIVGDIQRIIIYPQFGWQVESEVPEEIKEAYYYLKDLGFSQCILSFDEIKKAIDKHGVVSGQQENYFN